MEDASPLPIAGPTRVSPLRQSDARLARKAASGDESAFAAIFDRYSQDLYRYCRAILGDPIDAQDALQNTMTRVLQSLPGERRTIKLRPWLYRVARNESLTLIRERRQVLELTEGRAPAVPAADISAEHRESVRTLVADLASLPETQRSALVLHEMSGLSHEEISEALQRSPRASRQAIYEARMALQDLKEGRAMDCDDIRAMISDGDGRVMRGRKVRSHLRECQRCTDFELAIRHRRTQLGWLAPPLPAAAASGLIATVLGGGTGTGGALGAAGALGSSAVLKSIGIVGAGLAIGVGGAGVAGVDLPGGSAERPSQSSEQAESTPSSDSAAAPAGAATKASGQAGKAGEPGAKKQSRRKHGKPSADKSHGKKPSEAPGHAGDKAPGPPAHSNAGGSSSGPAANSNAGGNSAGPPAQSNAGGKTPVVPINSNAGATSSTHANSNAGGVSEPPAHSSAGGKSDEDSN